MLAAVGWWRRQTARHGSQAPFLDICLDKDESRLPKVDMHSAWTVRTHCWEKILRLETMSYVLELLPIPSEKNRACPRPITHSNYITLYYLRSVSWGVEGLIVSPMPS